MFEKDSNNSDEMRRIIALMTIVLLASFAARAQWSAGITGGASFNRFSMDKQYMIDYALDGLWGATLGVTGQYEISDWLALRADLNWTQKNHRMHRVKLDKMDYYYWNDYIQLPVMASFGFGGLNLRGFCNLGVYCGFWMDSYLSGSDFNNFAGYQFDISEPVTFIPERDQRFDFGPVGGVGVEYRILPNLSAQVELRCYYSTVSTTRQYMRVKDYRYNTTAVAQLGVSYIF